MLANAAASAPGVMTDPLPTVFLKNFADSGIVYESAFWLDDHRLYNAIADAVRTNIWYALRRRHMRIPNPIRQVHLERLRPATPPPSPTGGTTLPTARQPAAFSRHARGRLATLVQRSPIPHYGRGETIIHEKAEGASMFVLVTGERRSACWLTNNRPAWPRCKTAIASARCHS